MFLFEGCSIVYSKRSIAKISVLLALTLTVQLFISGIATAQLLPLATREVNIPPYQRYQVTQKANGYQSLAPEFQPYCSTSAYYDLTNDLSNRCLSGGGLLEDELNDCLCQKMVRAMDKYCMHVTAGCSLDSPFCEGIAYFLESTCF